MNLSLLMPNHLSAGKRPQSLHIKELEERLTQVQAAVVYSLNQLLDLKDLSTGLHSTRLAEWGVRLAESMGFDEEYQRDVEITAFLRDIGKIGVPDRILQKLGVLTPSERAEIKKHSEYGWGVLRLFPGFERVSLLVLHHHEAVDGSGYPAGLRGEEIPLGSRIICLLDAFDAMTADRCYRKGLPVEKALRRMREASGTQFDPALVEQFLPLAMQEAREVFDLADPLVVAA
jgi:HD-GYP domain-containing protein (c-di-GMP phosphodiesterase class II)